MKLQFTALALSFVSSAAFAETVVSVGSVSLLPADAVSYCPGDIRLVEESTYSEGGSVTHARLETSKVKDVSVSFHATTEKSVTWAIKYKNESFADCKASTIVRMTTEDGGVYMHTLYKASFKNGVLYFTFDLTSAGDNGAITNQNIKNGDIVLSFAYAD